MSLYDYKFTRVGHWEKSRTVKSGVTFVLNALKRERVIYSFVINVEPKYIGICEKDTTTLCDRMNRYKNQQGAGTNERISNKIRDELDKGLQVEIYALKPNECIKYMGVKLDLVKGLENPLILEFKPEWNR